MWLIIDGLAAFVCSTIESTERGAAQQLRCRSLWQRVCTRSVSTAVLTTGAEYACSVFLAASQGLELSSTGAFSAASGLLGFSLLGLSIWSLVVNFGVRALTRTHTHPNAPTRTLMHPHAPSSHPSLRLFLFPSPPQGGRQRAAAGGRCVGLCPCDPLRDHVADLPRGARIGLVEHSNRTPCSNTMFETRRTHMSESPIESVFEVRSRCVRDGCA